MPPPWKTVYNLFDPMQKLEGPTLKFFVARQQDQLERMAIEFQFADAPLHALLVGQRGTGKSSELRYLAQQLQGQFLPVLIDVDELTDLFNVNHVEVLFLLGSAIFAAGRVAGARLPEKLLKDLAQSIQSLVRANTESKDFTVPVASILNAIAVSVGAAAGGLAGAVLVSAATLFKDLKFNLGLTEQLVRKLEVKPQITEIVAAVGAIVRAVESAVGRRLLVIVDGLDRVDVEQGRQIFAESQVLDAPSCHLIYVIPAHLYYSPYLNLTKQIFKSVYALPNVKLRGRDGARHEAGYGFMREVVDKRVASVGLARGELFEPEALDQLAAHSGGMLREYIRLIQSAVLEATQKRSTTVTAANAQAAVDALRRDYMAGITPPLLAELVEVQRKGMPSGVQMGDVALQNQYVLCQTNRDVWYEVHPVIESYVREAWSKGS